MTHWPAVAAAVLLAVEAPAALADRDPNSGAPLPPQGRAAPTPITDHFYIRATFYDPQLRTNLRLDPTAPPGALGTPLNAESDLGLPGRLQKGRVEFMFRLRERSKVRVDYFESDRSGNKVLTHDVVFGNETFLAGDLAQTSLDWQQFDITYTYSFIRNSRFEVGAGLAAYFLDVDAIGYVPSTFQRQEETAATPIPAVPLDLTWAISSRWAATARGAYLRANLISFRGWYADTHEDLQYRWNPNLALGIGYSAIRTSLTRRGSNFSGAFYMSISGPEAFVRFSF